jgi:hypothetical protein
LRHRPILQCPIEWNIQTDRRLRAAGKP